MNKDIVEMSDNQTSEEKESMKNLILSNELIACACLGLMYDEPYCHCTMESMKLERSDKWKEANSPEALAEVNKKLNDFLDKQFLNRQTKEKL